MPLDHLIYELGYRPEDDSWDTDGRRTYVHDDDADPEFIAMMSAALATIDWRLDNDEKMLTVFRNPSGDQILEIEPGGDADGHLLHHMREIEDQ